MIEAVVPGAVKQKAKLHDDNDEQSVLFLGLHVQLKT